MTDHSNAVGRTGAQGLPGYDGSPGIGPAGPPGIAGEPGISGPPGPPGFGPPGPAGCIGPPGRMGPPGPVGPPGFGQPGCNGEQGFPGPQGFDGPTGAVGLKGDPDEVIFNLEGAATSLGAASSQVIVNNFDSVRFWSVGGLGLNVEEGSALVEVGMNNITAGNGVPVAAPVDPSRSALYINSNTNALYVWNPNLNGGSGQWVEATNGSGAGPVGAQGAQGADGAQGMVGETGACGAQGATGVQGATGAQGAQGAQGFRGFQGFQGYLGFMGFQGRDGPPGPFGPPGVNGQDGQDGTPGQIGTPGQDGQDGQDGKDGKSGQNAQNGADGTPGAQGAVGPPGGGGDIGPTGGQGFAGDEGEGASGLSLSAFSDTLGPGINAGMASNGSGQYIRITDGIDDVVFVTCQADVTYVDSLMPQIVSLGSLSEWGLPEPANFSTENQLSGVGISGNIELQPRGGTVIASPPNSISFRVIIPHTPNAGLTQTTGFAFSYRIN